MARADGAAGNVVGFCALHPTHDGNTGDAACEIAALYVLSSHWRQGIGRLLCEHTLAEAGARGFTDVLLWVSESNARALAFYGSMGFRPDGRTRITSEHAEATLHDLGYQRSSNRSACSSSG